MTFKQKQSLKIIIWVTTILVLLGLSVMRVNDYIRPFMTNDKEIHFTVFTLFMIVTHRVFIKMHLAWVCLITMSLSFLIEILQLLFTNGMRRFDWYDIAYNFFGVLLGLALLLVFKWFDRDCRSQGDASV